MASEVPKEVNEREEEAVRLGEGRRRFREKVAWVRERVWVGTRPWIIELGLLNLFIAAFWVMGTGESLRDEAFRYDTTRVNLLRATGELRQLETTLDLRKRENVELVNYKRQEIIVLRQSLTSLANSYNSKASGLTSFLTLPYRRDLPPRLDPEEWFRQWAGP